MITYEINNFKIVINEGDEVDLNNIKYFIDDETDFTKGDIMKKVIIYCKYKNKSIDLFKSDEVYNYYDIEYNFTILNKDKNEVTIKLFEGIRYRFNDEVSIDNSHNILSFIPNITKQYKIVCYKTNNIKIDNYVPLNSLCDDVLILNLEHEKTKFDNVMNLLKAEDIKVNRYVAINGNDTKYDIIWEDYKKKPLTKYERKIGRKALLSRGALGYLLSAKAIFEKSKRNCQYICFIDDDIGICKNFSDELSKIIQRLSFFKILKLGSSQWKWEHKIKKGYYDANMQSNGSFFNIYRYDTFKKILDKVNEIKEPFDCEPLRQFINDNYYIAYPNLVIANLDNISTISGKKRTNEYNKFKWEKCNYLCS